MAITPETEAETLRIYRENPRRFSPFKTANSVGISITEVFAIIEENREKLAQAQEKFGGFGRPEIQPFIVARRQGGGSWDNSDPQIAKARADYEAGTHDMATGRDGQWLILYSMPRKRRDTTRAGYFTLETS